MKGQKVGNVLKGWRCELELGVGATVRGSNLIWAIPIVAGRSAEAGLFRDKY
jgi:hypothetical protein